MTWSISWLRRMGPATAALVAVALAASAASMPTAVRPGETVVFLGDSITWQNLYPAYIESYFLRAHPDWNLRFVNLGVRGDTAADALARLRRDLVPLRPDRVLILLGMNDGGYRGRNRLLLRAYLANLEQLLEGIRANTTAQIMLLTPTCVDPVDARRQRYNLMLADMARAVVELGQRKDIPVLKLHQDFAAALDWARAQPSPVQLMHDPIHPGPAGHLVIARFLLRHLGAGREKRTVIDANSLSWHENRSQFKLGHHHDNIYLPPAARSINAGFNQHLLVLDGLAQNIRLCVGDTDLGSFTPAQMQAGIDLNRIDAAPWVREAKILYRLLQEKWRLSYYLWDPRDLGPDALLAPSPPRPPKAIIDLNEAYRQLNRVSAQIDSRPLPPQTVYHLEIIRQSKAQP